MRYNAAMSNPWKDRVVGVVMGGLSAEREVSLNTGVGVLAALQERGYRAVAIDWKDGTRLPDLLASAGVAVVWNALHGTYGEDGAVQGLCTCLGIACTGSGILASALAMDKVMSKRIFESNGVPTPAWRLLPGAADGGPVDGSDGPAALADHPLPLVVKPANEGSSVGVSVVEDRAELAAAVALARRHHGPVLVEDYIAGTEVFVGILDGAVLGSVEVKPGRQASTTTPPSTSAPTPRTSSRPSSPRAVVARAEELALAAYKRARLQRPLPPRPAHPRRAARRSCSRSTPCRA
jgi:D-alanine-D-alanine ligase